MTPPSTKPILVFISGAWHSPGHFERLITHLESYEYTCQSIPLLSVNPADPSTITIEDDISEIRTSIQSILTSYGRNVVVVAHSYGAVPTMSAIADLSSASLGADKPHVQAIALICSFLLPPRTGTTDRRNGKPAPWYSFSADGLLVTPTDPGPEHLFYTDLSAAEAKHNVSLLKPHSWTCLSGRPSQEKVGWFDIPTAYLVCQNDQAIPEAYQREMIAKADEMLEGRGSEMRVQVEECTSSHSPFLSMVERTGDYIRRAAGEDTPVA